MVDAVTLIIVEGCDGVGKTTFVELLQRCADYDGRTFRLLHRGPPTAHPLAEYELDLEGEGDPRLYPHRITVCDRWHLGELIYGPLYRGRSRLDNAGLIHVEAFLRARGALLVRLIHSPLEVTARLRKRGGDDVLLYRDVALVLDAYRRFESHLPMMTFTDPTEVQARAVLAVANRLAEDCRGLLSYPGYVGSPYATALFVGDVRGARGPRHRAAFVPYPSTSGHYLLPAIRDAQRTFQGRSWPEWGIVNANDDDDVEGLWRFLDRPPIVALGSLAYETLSRRLAHAPIGAVPHPQYVRRFHHARRADYAAQIAAAVDRQVDRRKVSAWT